jgi:hypothetical protein
MSTLKDWVDFIDLEIMPDDEDGDQDDDPLFVL